MTSPAQAIPHITPLHMPTIAIPKLHLPHPTLRAGKADGEFTVYVDRKAFLDATGKADEHKNTKSLDFQTTIYLEDQPETAITARGHAALCFEGRMFSVTVRSKSILKAAMPTVVKATYLPEPGKPYPSNRALFEKLKDSEDSLPPGLILIAGGTASGKTTTLNQLVSQHLKHRLKHMAGKVKARYPHVVVIGDPIETFFFCGTNQSLPMSCDAMLEATDRAIDFTPRLLAIDVDSVQAALTDALRETPEFVVVSELRVDQDFHAALDFAATGHRIIATCHTGSLVEVFSKLLAASDGSHSASDRAALVYRLAGVVHVVQMDGFFVPSVWIPSAQGRQDFISEGLSSIIPAPRVGSNPKGVTGRYGMLQRMAELDKKTAPAIKKLLVKALARDLAGE
jgi:hypothetical protein